MLSLACIIGFSLIKKELGLILEVEPNKDKELFAIYYFSYLIVEI